MSLRSYSSSIKAQQGNVYIVAVFVIMVMGMLALSLTRIGWSNQETLTREVLGNQALLLAKSGNEWALTYLFPLDQDDDFDSVSGRCTSLSGSADSAATALATNSSIPCRAPDVVCEEPPPGLPDELQYFKVSTRAICGNSEIFQVERAQTVWVKGVKSE